MTNPSEQIDPMTGLPETEEARERRLRQAETTLNPTGVAADEAAKAEERKKDAE